MRTPHDRRLPERSADVLPVLAQEEQPWRRRPARFFADRIFGPDRTSILEAELATVDDTAARARVEDRERLQRTGADIETPAPPTPSDLSLLDAIPYLRVNLARAPQTLLQMLFEVTQLTVQLNGLGDVVTIGVNLPADQVPAIAEAGERITDAMSAPEIAKSADQNDRRFLGGSCTYPRWDSNPRYRRERPAS